MIKNINRFVGMFLVILLSLMTVDVLWGVVTRYVVGDQANWTDELARFLLIWIGVLGAAYVHGQNEHLSINLLASRLSQRQHHLQTVVVHVLVILFAISVFILGGFRLIYITMVLDQSSPSLGLPMGLVYAVLPVSGVLISFYSFISILESFIHTNETASGEF